VSITNFNFPYRPRADDPNAVFVVQRNVDFLAARMLQLTTHIDSGSNIVFSGSTSQLVLFSVNLPTAVVTATPTADPGGRWWISGVNSSGFTFHLEIAAPTAGVPFDWIARGSAS